MQSTLTTNVRCMLLKNGLEMWMSQKTEDEIAELMTGESWQEQWSNFKGNRFRLGDVSGFYSAESMAEMRNKKQGKWKCKQGNWHGRSEKCECQAERGEARTFCGNCENGWVFRADTSKAYYGQALASPCRTCATIKQIDDYNQYAEQQNQLARQRQFE